jgi:hypothetical protein
VSETVIPVGQCMTEAKEPGLCITVQRVDLSSFLCARGAGSQC